MNFKELREEFVASGFDDLGQSSERVKRWCNQSYFELCEEKPWPFLGVATKEGTAPQSIEDLGHVLAVVDKTHENPLRFAEERELVGYDSNLDDTGSASRWYREGETKLKVWPADTSSTFFTRYLKVPTELKEDADKPLVPSRYQDLIVTGMVIRGLRRKNNYEDAALERQEWERGVRQMVKALLQPNYDGPKTVLRTGAPEDYIG